MDGSIITLIELIAVFGGVLVFVALQLRSLRRYDKEAQRKGTATKASEPPSSDGARHPERQQGLDP